MAITNLPALHFGCVTKAPTAFLISDWLDAIYDALLHLTATATYDDGSVVPAAAKWVVTRVQNAGLTEFVYAVPAASSPAVNKLVLMWAGAAAGTHASVAMASPDTYTNGYLLFGVAVANSGQNIGTINAWDSASPVDNARFGGYVRVGSTASTQIKVFVSSEYIFSQVLANGAGATCWGGYGIRAPTTDILDSESDRPGAIVDFGTSGGSGIAAADSWNSVASNRGWFLHGSGVGEAHNYIITPNGSTLKKIGYRTNTASGGGICVGQDSNCISYSGATIPVRMQIRDAGNSGTDGAYLGYHRAVHFCGRNKSGALITDAGDTKWLIIGVNSCAGQDAAALPI